MSTLELLRNAKTAIENAQKVRERSLGVQESLLAKWKEKGFDSVEAVQAEIERITAQLGKLEAKRDQLAAELEKLLP
jgi:cell division protein FtsB